MTNATVTRLGSINGGADALALFQKLFSGEVLTAFTQKTVMMDKHVVREISNGKSASFPAIGNFTASYHTAGTELLGRVVNHGERVILVDGYMESHTFIASIDEAMNHYDVMAEYTKKLGEALADKTDENILKTGILAARATATVTGGHGGGRLAAATINTDTSALITLIYSAAEMMDSKNVPAEDRYLFVRPDVYYRLARDTTLLNRDFGGTGVYTEAKLPRVAGMTIVSTVNLPRSNVAGVDTRVGVAARYAVNATNTYALAMHKEAIGTVKLGSLKLHLEFDPRRLGTLAVAYHSVGHDILRPECAVEIVTAV